MHVTIYSTVTCSWCRRAEALLRQHGVPFRVIDVTDDPEARAALIERAHGRRTVPVIFHGDALIGGFVELAALAARRGLAHLAAAPGAAATLVARPVARTGS